MISFTVFCKKSDLVKSIQELLKTEFQEDLEFYHIVDQERIEHHLYYDAPQFVLFDLDDPGMTEEGMVKKIVNDPLLFNVRFLGMSGKSSEHLPAYPGIFSVMTYTQLGTLLPHIVNILSYNQQLVLQTGMIQQLGRTGTLSIENKPLLLEGYAELISSFLYGQNLIDIQTKYGLKFSLVEMLMNAVEHGNCEIDYEEKTNWLESGKDIVQLIEEKCKDETIASKRVKLKFEIFDKESHFVINDEGPGFDVSTLPDPEDVLAIMELHGRGVFMTRNYVKELTYNDKGNEVKLVIIHTEDPSRSVPEGFMNSQMMDFKPGDIIFQKNDKSNSLYYIVGGEFEILSGEKVVTTLNNTDIFLGEMAFLLGNRRTATVRAKTEGQLVAINALEWMTAVQKYPHYGIFLARLLANKLHEQTQSLF
ncbi:MAG: cyclic nucleotide-binding domain-containing protein [SAR324 cluster bacterium]|nr:cyclic nucleotide-binding domain-containing protein [SAR324 cluster bacterium]